MDSDDKVAVCFIVAIAFCVCVLIAGVSYFNVNNLAVQNEQTKAAMQNGYSQKTLPGVTGAYWVKDSE
jgi:hypothetical protein